MGEDGGEPNKPGFPVDRGRLHRRNLVLAQALANNIEAARERGIAEGPILLTRERRADGGSQRFLWVGNLSLGLGQRRRDGADRFTGVVHGYPPWYSTDQ